MTHYLNLRATPAQRLGALASVVLALAGHAALAATPEADGGVAGLQQLATGRAVGLGGAAVPISRPGVDATAEVNALLNAPLSAEAAVRIALLNNPGWQASLAGAGINISDTAPNHHPAKLKARQDLTLLSAQARKAWITAVATAQSAASLLQAQETAQTAGELSRRMAQVGNLSKLQQAKDQLLLSEATLQLARAQQAAFNAREQLIGVLGLWGGQTGFALPAELPALPPQAQELPDVESRAVRERMDLRLAQDRWQRQRASQPRPASADALWDAMGDAAGVRALAVSARSEARQVYHRYRMAYDVARHHQDEVLPLRKFINDETVLRYNGMLLSVFDLLADTRAQALGTSSAIDAQRDFWLAEADLQTLLAGAPVALPSEAQAAGSSGIAAASAGGH
jgi:multidrug efflux system outer membrane protein